MGLLGLSGCGSPSSASVEMSSQTELVKTGSMELQYAENFAVDYYEDGYKMLTTLPDSKRYLLVPEGQPVPQGLDEDVSILQEPLQNIYLVASGVMDMFASLDAVGQIRFSGQKQENWYIQTAKDAMAAGDMIYAGKYSKPDYELLVSEGCDLAIENRMITHSPEVVEMLQSFDIPVMIEYSSYEQHPLGKVEWVKFFGALTGKEAKAEEAFAEQTEILEEVESGEKTGKTIAFFYVTSNGLIQVRQSTDYIPKLIELAGGRYIFENLEDSGSGRSTLNMQVEDFYAGAKDADILIYNSSIDGGVTTVDELIGKCNILKDFKALQEGQDGAASCASCTCRIHNHIGAALAADGNDELMRIIKRRRVSCVICFSYSKMEDLETQRKYKSVRMRLEYDWNTNRKRRRKTCSSAEK